MANTSSEGAIKNMAFEGDDKSVDGVADTGPGVHFDDDKQNRVFVVPLSKHSREDEKGRLTEDSRTSECLKGKRWLLRIAIVARVCNTNL